LSDITAWFDNNSAPNILWLCGAPGTGKTTISWSLIEELKRQQRCAGFFFFQQGRHTPSKLWRTLAYEMATYNPAIESEILNIATRTSDKLDLNDVEATFSKLVCGPLKTTNSSPSSRNPIFLIDALDQCRRAQDNSRTQETLLDTLLEWSSLPPHCKLIITSRPQYDIAKAFEGRDIKRMELLTGDDVDYTTQQGVRAYLSHRFVEMRRQDKSISEHWPNGDAIFKLADHTKGIFKWAADAVDWIQAARDKEKQLTTIIEGGTSTKLDPFDKYLKEVLKMVFEGNVADAFESYSPDSYEGSSSEAVQGHSSDVFRETLGVIALSKQPLTMTDLKYFLQDHFASTSGVSIEDVCYRLLPIISIEDEIRFRHNAYKDYLIDFERCKLFDDAFYGNGHRKMTILCLEIMQQDLKFNICRLKSSYRVNNQVEDKDALIERCVPSYLAYACQYWADHLRGITTVEQRDSEIVFLLRNFLNSHLLHWLEVLSLLSKSQVAPKSLLVAAEWLEASSIAMLSFRRYYRRTMAKNLSLLAADASRFSLTFVDVISASAPHIYLSALPFAPPSSLVSELYRNQFPHTIKVIHGEEVKWPAMRYSISTSDCVYDISIHSNGKRVAAAMGAGVATVFSMITGESLFSLSGHRESVRAISYGPTSKRIATGALS
jgi:NACHT domain-containing protein